MRSRPHGLDFTISGRKGWFNRVHHCGITRIYRSGPLTNHFKRCIVTSPLLHRIIRSFGLRVLALTSSLCAGAETVAYWSFENGNANQPVPHLSAAGVFHGSTPDLSGNGNHLSTWSQGGSSGFLYRAEVPYPIVPQLGTANHFSIRNTGAYPASFTSASDSRPTGINADTFTPARFTIEASYKPEATGGHRTVVSRDARGVSASNGSLAALYLQVRPDDSVRILFTDVSGHTHQATSPPGWIYGFNASSTPDGTGHPWYQLAAVSDGETLSLYVNHELVAATDVTLSGSPDTALAVGSVHGSGWKAGAWAVGRGLYAGAHADRAPGFIDEVRISAADLSPSDFLGAPVPRFTRIAHSGGSLTLQVSQGRPGDVCLLRQSSGLEEPGPSWAPIAESTFDEEGNASFSRAIGASEPRMFYVAENVPQPPSRGAMTYSLASGSENWPTAVRNEIIYAMDGAVAQYNRWGHFPKRLTVNYNPAVPTAQASYSGWIDFGGNASYRNFRTALHEIAHTLGVGTHRAWAANLAGGVWQGAEARAQVQDFDGPAAEIRSDGTHFWPYGLNYDSEGNTENHRRHVLIVAALRRDMGL